MFLYESVFEIFPLQFLEGEEQISRKPLSFSPKKIKDVHPEHFSTKKTWFLEYAEKVEEWWQMLKYVEKVKKFQRMLQNVCKKCI